jgi:hypothetical protein
MYMRKTHVTFNQFIATAGLIFVMPLLAFAQFGDVDNFAATIITFINNVLIPLIFAFGLVTFIWGMFRFFILGGGDEEQRAKGKSLMLFAILGFVMMIIIFSVVNLFAEGLLEGLGQTNDGITNLPGLKN